MTQERSSNSTKDCRNSAC
uniref:Uncharacterized protein n=1 Tax=Rhizophora mucronata TaxID=61149 RepID=A0A2P2PSA3_RHIMU